MQALEGLQKLVLPDQWQAEALRYLEEGQSVVVDAPTGAGKTYVFEKFVERHGGDQRTLFTAPTRALANDKFAEWSRRGWSVGIITGDLVIRPRAPIVVATLEAVQSMDLAAERFRLVAIDEYQWIADPLRGNHYEGFLMHLPPHLPVLLLSGSVRNAPEVASWLGRLGKPTALVSSKERPVPLEEMDADEMARYAPKGIEGFWAKRVAGALREQLGPVLLFAPRRQEAERLARQLARELPLPEPLGLTTAQQNVLGPKMTRLLQNRVAYHHSGLSYAQRAGVIEPLAKNGQLRAVVATLGLSAGINFSLRSVCITAQSYFQGGFEKRLGSTEILQMAGRAGRRGLDERGYFLASRKSPRLHMGAQSKLRRAAPLPWAFLLRKLAEPMTETVDLQKIFRERLFAEIPPTLGNEETPPDLAAELPCQRYTDTARARLVRRTRKPFRACTKCPHRETCLNLSPQPTLLWQWQRTGLLDQSLRITPRGALVSGFLGPEGLAVAAVIEDQKYPLENAIFDLANLFAGERFCGTNPRELGALAVACRKAYRRFSIPGFLEYGLPPQYGDGGGEAVRAIIENKESRRSQTNEHAGKGDVDRLLTEWTSLLRQIAQHPLESENTRWHQLQSWATAWLENHSTSTLPALPDLTAEQQKPIPHHFFLKPRGR
ncbi:MAG: DEAD/DEAH box helicase [Opitutales bacterium]|nr:DEAD/DEAH box helicase [Opitutales bacterium]